MGFAGEALEFQHIICVSGEERIFFLNQRRIYWMPSLGPIEIHMITMMMKSNNNDGKVSKNQSSITYNIRRL